MEYELFCPPPKLCTDNGIMIAWNGMERWKAGVGIAHDLDAVNIMGKYDSLSDQHVSWIAFNGIDEEIWITGVL